MPSIPRTVLYQIQFSLECQVKDKCCTIFKFMFLPKTGIYDGSMEYTGKIFCKVKSFIYYTVLNTQPDLHFSLKLL